MLNLSTIKKLKYFPFSCNRQELKFRWNDVEALCERWRYIEERHAALFRETISCIKLDCSHRPATVQRERAKKAFKMEAGESRGVGATHT